MNLKIILQFKINNSCFFAHFAISLIRGFTSRNFKFKIPLNCTDGITLPQYGIYKKQNTGKKLNNSISSAG
jgi:hypothetical protein